MIPKTLSRAFRTIGRDIFLRGLISSHAGNMSVRAGGTIYITRRGSMLGALTAGDLVEVALEGGGSARASSELVVHRAIYLATGARAVIHAHPPYATLLSMSRDELIPFDSEGSHLLRKVPVVTAQETVGSPEAAALLSERLRDFMVVLLRGHGSFARGDTLEEAFMYTSGLEASCFFLHHLGDKAGNIGGSPRNTKTGRRRP